MKLTKDRSTLTDFAASSRLEWLETNGLGGWASSSLAGANTRRYHGLLVAATEPPVGRTVLLAKLDETVTVGDQHFELATNQFPGVVHPSGHQHLEAFSLDLMPRFTFALADVRLHKTVAALDGENTTLVVYELDEKAPEPVTLELRPLVAGRGFHEVGRAGARSFEVLEGGSTTRITSAGASWELFIELEGSELVRGDDWYYNFEYPFERYRGLEFREDLWTPGYLRRQLEPGASIAVVISDREPGGRDWRKLLSKERKRRLARIRELPETAGPIRQLARAADQFVVRRGDDLRTVIAGYPWFGDWGRDTMIALPGLALVTGRLADAKKILRAFAASVSQGMLPNRFPDDGEEPEYNTVDATLWFFVAIYRYLVYSGDREFVDRELVPVLRDILEWHDRGTRYGIAVADDGLLAAGEPGVQLTWMDAKVGDWVVTPRQGKAVEINALWYNALRILAELESHFGRPDRARSLATRAEGVRRTFCRTFWFEDGKYLHDVIGAAGPDSSLRPNQIFALSLPFPLLSKARAKCVLARVEQALLTPVGLRSLSADHPDYRGIYGGDALSRDSVYHQGTVWSWLLGPFVTALVRVRGEAGRRQAAELLDTAFEHLEDACIGTVSEIFDGQPPHEPRGAPAQAWSVAELLRAYFEDVRQISGGAMSRSINPPVGESLQ